MKIRITPLFVAWLSLLASVQARQVEQLPSLLLAALKGQSFAGLLGKDYRTMPDTQTTASGSQRLLEIRAEHLALNVTDPAAVVQWYTTHLGMKVLRQGGPPTLTAFIADSGGHMMLELQHNVDYPVLDFPKMSHNSLHLAFMVGDIGAVKSKLLAAGASLVEDITKTPSGDQVLMLRDPWGLSIQFAQRVKPMLTMTGVRLEHLAINLHDSRAQAKWFVDNLGMRIVREGGAPDFGRFVSDAGGNMMFELYQKSEYPVLDFKSISHMSLHFASIVPDVQAAKNLLLKAGGTVAADVTKSASGDEVVTMRDRTGIPLQFVKRVAPMLK